MAAKISATEAAVLGLLTRGELSGYDLQREAESVGGFFWAPTKSRIYAVLPTLVDRGYATSREVLQTGRPNKQLYTITESGRDVVQGWLEEPPVFEPERAPLLLKLYFGDLLPPEKLLEHVHALKTQASALKKKLEEHPHRHDAYAQLAYTHTLEWLKALIRWASSTERELAQRVNR